MLCFKVDYLVNLLGREDVIAHGDVVYKDTFEFVGLRAQNFVLLEGFEVVYGEVADNWLLTVAVGGFLGLLEGELCHGGDSFLGRGLGVRVLKVNLFSVDKIHSVSVDDTVTLTLNFKVVGNQVN